MCRHGLYCVRFPAERVGNCDVGSQVLNGHSEGGVFGFQNGDWVGGVVRVPDAGLYESVTDTGVGPDDFCTVSPNGALGAEHSQFDS